MSDLPRAIFFDFDNTLQDLDAAFNEAVTTTLGPVCMGAGVGLDVLVSQMNLIWPELWVRAQEGRIRESDLYPLWFTEAFRRIGIPEARMQAWAIGGVYQAAFESHLRLYDDVLPALSALKETRPDLLLGVLTNGPSARQRRRIRSRGLGRYITHIVTSEDVGRAKPDPAVFLQGLQEAGVSGPEAVMIGDDPQADVAGAQAAGLRAIWLDRRDLHTKVGVMAASPVAKDLLEACHLALEDEL